MKLALTDVEKSTKWQNIELFVKI